MSPEQGLKDSSGRNNHGTLTNGPTQAKGTIGQALSFDSTNDMVLVTGDLLGTGPITLAAWIKPSSIQDVRIFSNTGGNTELEIETPTSNLLLTCGSNARSPNNSIRIGNWYHVVATRTSAHLVNLYINGVSSGTTNQDCGAPASGATETTIGGTSGASNAFNGLIDDARIYNRVLSAGEINKLYQMGR